jgi:hypothetical protein
MGRVWDDKWVSLDIGHQNLFNTKISFEPNLPIFISSGATPQKAGPGGLRKEKAREDLGNHRGKEMGK